MTMQKAERPQRQMVTSASIWEPRIGSCRGVRVGSQIFIAGTAPVDGEDRVQGADAYQQTCFIISKIQKALQELGADLTDVVSTVAYLSDIRHFEDYARAHRQYFREIRPVNTTVQAALLRPEFLLEIAATAVTTT